MNEQPKSVPEESKAHAVHQSAASRWATMGRRLLSSLGGAIRLFIVFLIGVLVVFVARDWDWWQGSAARQVTNDAYLQADLTPLAAKSPGYVRTVLVGDFQRVKAGDI